MKWIGLISIVDSYTPISSKILLIFKSLSSSLCTTNLLLLLFSMSSAVSSYKLASAPESSSGESTMEGTANSLSSDLTVLLQLFFLPSLEVSSIDGAGMNIRLCLGDTLGWSWFSPTWDFFRWEMDDS